MRALATFAVWATLSVVLVACGSSNGSKPPLMAPTKAASVSSISGYQTTNKPKHGVSYRTHQIGPYRNDGDQDLVGDEDGDNRTDVDSDAGWDYKPEIDENDYYHDADDAKTAEFGHPASAADAQAVTAVVKRYYAAAAGEDGTQGCAQLDPTIALAAPLDYGRFGPAYLRGAKSCPAVLTRLFEHSRATFGGAVTVTSVRVEGDHALALLASSKVPASYIGLQGQAGHWGIEQLLSTALN